MEVIKCSLCDREMEVVSLAGGLEGAQVAHLECAIRRLREDDIALKAILAGLSSKEATATGMYDRD